MQPNRRTPLFAATLALSVAAVLACGDRQTIDATPPPSADDSWESLLAELDPYRGPAEASPRRSVAAESQHDTHAGGGSDQDGTGEGDSGNGDGDSGEPQDLDAAYQEYLDFQEVVQNTTRMVYDAEARRLAGEHDLGIMNVTWEDTGRFHGSAVGPNISDMTIQVQTQNPRTKEYQLHMMPVIRFPNFTDKTADLPLERFFMLTGNERGDKTYPVGLREYLGDLRRFLHDDTSWAGGHMSLLAERDSHVLVSAQACFLPIPRGGAVEFNPVLFNYQSSEGNPAVLTILVTPQGTSATIIDNSRDGFDAHGGRNWGQRLFFNQDGMRASLRGERVSDVQAREGEGAAPTGPATSADGHEAAGESGVNMVMVIQVPLKHDASDWGWVVEDALGELTEYRRDAQGVSDTEDAAISAGRVEGPFTEIDNLEIERDPDYPVRVTVQFYKATSTGVVSEQDIREIAEQIERVYAQADYVGSLVVDGSTGRPTEHDGPKVQPIDWWQNFWNHHYQNTGMDRAETLDFLGNLFGDRVCYLNQEEWQRLHKSGVYTKGALHTGDDGHYYLETEHGKVRVEAEELDLSDYLEGNIEAIGRPTRDSNEDNQQPRLQLTHIRQAP